MLGQDSAVDLIVERRGGRLYCAGLNVKVMNIGAHRSRRRLGSAGMGATAQQDFAINFLAALNNIWSEHSGTFQVAETEELLPALAQISIRWLAATAREQLPAGPRNLQVRGDVRYDVAEIEPDDAFRHRRTISLQNSLNHIVHAEPEWVSVQGREVILCWKYTPQYGADLTKHRPYCAYFLADSLIAAQLIATSTRCPGRQGGHRPQARTPAAGRQAGRAVGGRRA
jgi:hypothetical protein